MNRIAAKPVLQLVLALAVPAAVAPFAAPAAASTAEEFLNAPVWYIQYEVTVTSSTQGTRPVPSGQISYTSTYERVMTDSKEFNLRSQGPGPISMGAMAGSNTGDMSAAEAQQKAIEMSSQMMASMEHSANWLAAGSGIKEDVTQADIAADMAPSSPSRIHYRLVETGKGLMTEMGTIYDLTRTTTIKGEANVSVIGMGFMVLELDSAKKTYALVLPFGSSPTGPTVKREVISITQSKGQAPNEERETEDVTNPYPSRLALDVPQSHGIQGGVLMRGTFDPATGKIAGEQTFAVHFDEGGDTIPATVKFKYTLTTTKPKK